jgi:outer membrane protein TolC
MALALLSAPAEAAAAHLTEEEVLAASARHYPSIVESLARRRGAEGKALEAEGAFDVLFSADGVSRPAGYYDGTVVRGGVRRALGALGANVYADFRLSDGTFPPYEDMRYTSDRGELKIGALFSLLRDRDIDEQRFGRVDAALALRIAELDVLLTRLGVQQRALIAYWRWVAAGRTLEVYRNLLQIARDREAALEGQVRAGAQASIFLVENRQNITRRETFVANAARDFRLAANELSMFYRDTDGRPRLPDAGALPPAPPMEVPEPRPAALAVNAAVALARRPEIEVLRAEIERAENRVALASNALRPRVDVNVELARDFGSIAEGSIPNSGSDARIGVSFSVPFEQRVARGKLQQERAAIAATAAQQRLKQDQIRLELDNIVLDLDVAEEVLRLAAAQVDQTELVRAAEQRRFENGASDFFIVNIRERRRPTLESSTTRRTSRAVSREQTTTPRSSIWIDSASAKPSNCEPHPAAAEKEPARSTPEACVL